MTCQKLSVGVIAGSFEMRSGGSWSDAYCPAE
jgi:hypothetical protein